MKCYEFHDADLFYKMVADILMEDEVVNSLPLAILKAFVSKTKDVNFKQPPFFAYIGEENSPQFILVMTPPQNLIVCGSELDLDTSVPIAVDYLIQHKIQIPGVIGTTKLAEAFKQTYISHKGGHAELAMSQRIYKLEKVHPVETSPGFLRVATPDDVTTITEWLITFAKEAMNEDMDPTYAKDRAERGVAFKTIHLWEDHGEMVSMVNKTKPTQNGITVSMVYTPNEKRGKGYASSCVATMSQKLLDAGYHYVSLYTDLLNPTSNSIYQKIGYHPVTDSIVYRFSKE